MLGHRPFMNWPADLFSGASDMLRLGLGIDVQVTGFNDGQELLRDGDEDLVLQFLRGCYAHLRRLENQGGVLPVSASDFEKHTNEILEADEAPVRLRNAMIIPLGQSDAEVLRRTLLENPADVAACQQGDVQVEMVVSTIQARLNQPDAVLVDYGVGLGRVLAGLASAKRFATTTYVGVEEPVPPEVKALAGRVGAKAIFRRRTEYLAAPNPADVILAVNVLHHIPFNELAGQFASLLSSLKPGGILVLHEMGELHVPEQRNVPWRIEDIQRLFDVDAVDVNSRTTVSKGKKVPLSNVIITVKTTNGLEAALRTSAEKSWRAMKQRTLEEIRELYEAGDADHHVELQRLLITNANLDLNAPS